MKVRVVGQDPSMNNWGLVAADVDLNNDCKIEIVEMKVITNEKKKLAGRKLVRKTSLDYERVRDLHGSIVEFFDKHKPKITMAEVPSGGKSANALKSAHMCVTILGCIPTPLINLTQNECKIHAFNNRSASKQQSIEWAMSRFPDADWKMRKLKGQLVSVDGYNEHIADACIALETGLYSEEFIKIVEVAKLMSA